VDRRQWSQIERRVGVHGVLPDRLGRILLKGLGRLAGASHVTAMVAILMAPSDLASFAGVLY